MTTILLRPPIGLSGLAAAVFLLASCESNGPDVATGLRLELAAGRVQTGTVGRPLDTLLVVRVFDAQGRRVKNVPVTFSIPQGAGTLISSGRSDDLGLAVAGWTMPTTVGTYFATATGADQTLTFTATARAGPAVLLEVVDGNGQTGPASQALEDPIVVRLSDQYGNPVQGTTIAFTLTPGNGSALTAIGPSGPSGQVTTSWVLGETPGPMLMRAKAPNLPRAIITATATPPPQ